MQVSLLHTRAVSRKKVPNGLSWCHTKRRMAHPSFDMTPTQAIRDRFVNAHECYFLTEFQIFFLYSSDPLSDWLNGHAVRQS